MKERKNIMATSSKSALVVSDWEETQYTQLTDGAALARATSAAVFTGDLEGTSTCAWLLAYPPEAAPSFVGTQSFEGTLHGRKGTFVLQLSGTFADNSANVTWSIMPGTGTGELRGLRGSGGYSSGGEEPAATATLDYELS
jgi:hypothetical protein